VVVNSEVVGLAPALKLKTLAFVLCRQADQVLNLTKVNIYEGLIHCGGTRFLVYCHMQYKCTALHNVAAAPLRKP
jgi:hypothetical protein